MARVVIAVLEVEHVVGAVAVQVVASRPADEHIRGVGALEAVVAGTAVGLEAKRVAGLRGDVEVVRVSPGVATTRVPGGTVQRTS